MRAVLTAGMKEQEIFRLTGLTQAPCDRIAPEMRLPMAKDRLDNAACPASSSHTRPSIQTCRRQMNGSNPFGSEHGHEVKRGESEPSIRPNYSYFTYP
jgi:hypothetical protein